MRRSALTVAMLVAAGCATGYQPRGFSGGYSDLQLGENVFQVTFNGNGYTKAERAADFALLRCAEVAREHGFPFFVLVSGENSTRTSSYTTPTTTTGVATASGNTVYGTATTTGGQTYYTVKPSSKNTVLGLRSKPDGVAYESEYVIRAIRQKYGLPPG